MEVSKVVRFLVGAVGMRLVSCLVLILRAYSFIPVVQAGHRLATAHSWRREATYVRSRRDETNFSS